MLFNSIEFLFFFLPVTLVGFFALGAWAGHRFAIAWLVVASLFFYAWWNPVYLVLIGFSMLMNYGFGFFLSRSLHQRTDKRRALLIVSVALNLGLLGYFKYANFFVHNVNLALGSAFHLEHIVLPLGISFFTFTQIAYLVDAYRGEAREYNFLHYALFVTFFPHLIAGPILHHKEMMPQFGNRQIFSPRAANLAIGATIFFIGLFKKVVLADAFALHATPVFARAETGAALGFFEAWEGAWSYTFQLYFDFSGYSDMAVGLARMFGVRFPVNFNSPYRATNIIDFWRRWHITLSRFLRDYLYFALGGNRKGKVRRYVNLMLTMILGGAWHGAGWTFVAWGFLHGAYLVANHAWRSVVPWRGDHWTGRLLARSVTLLCVLVGWVFFRAETFHGALTMLRGMMNLPTALGGRFGRLQPLLESVGFQFSGGYVASQHYLLSVWLVFWLAIVWYWPNTQEWMRRYRPILEVASIRRDWPAWMAWAPTWGWAIITAGIAILGLLGLSAVTEFLYFQF